VRLTFNKKMVDQQNSNHWQLTRKSWQSTYWLTCSIMQLCDLHGKVSPCTDIDCNIILSWFVS